MQTARRGGAQAKHRLLLQFGARGHEEIGTGRPGGRAKHLLQNKANWDMGNAQEDTSYVTQEREDEREMHNCEFWVLTRWEPLAEPLPLHGSLRPGRLPFPLGSKYLLTVAPTQGTALWLGLCELSRGAGVERTGLRTELRGATGMEEM